MKLNLRVRARMIEPLPRSLHTDANFLKQSHCTVDHRDGEFHNFLPQYHWNFTPNWVNFTVKKRISHQKGPQNFHGQYDAFRPLFTRTFTYFCSEFRGVPGLKLGKRISLSSTISLIAALICVVQVQPSTKVISTFI
jgi:hypothetical protein